MLATVNSCTLMGLTVYEIEVEVDAAGGLPDWNIVGLPDTAVKESKERVRTAIKNSGFDFPPRRIVVNLAPAHIKKEGPSFDLPIALAILAATNQIDPEKIKEIVAIGELGLDGKLRKVNGILPISLFLANEQKKLVLPSENGREGAIGGTPTYAFDFLRDVVNFLECPDNHEPINAPNLVDLFQSPISLDYDFKYVKGQAGAKEHWRLQLQAAIIF